MERILSRWEIGISCIRPMRLTTTRRSAPAISAPRLKALLTTAKNVKRTRAMAKEPMVRIRRSFLLKRLANMRLLYFTLHLPRRARQVRRIQPADLSQDGALDRHAWRRPGRA